MTTAAAFGARAALVPCSPMINLTAIADRLADHLTGPLNAPLIQVQGDRIVIDPIPTLRALCVGLGEKPIDFLETDLEAFSKIVVRKVGAGIGNDRNAAATAVERIRNILRPQIDAALASDSARPAVDAALSFFAGSTKGKHFLERTPEIASIVPATFGDNASSAIGKTLLAIERVTATDWKSRIIQALEGAAAKIAIGRQMTSSASPAARAWTHQASSAASSSSSKTWRYPERACTSPCRSLGTLPNSTRQTPRN